MIPLEEHQRWNDMMWLDGSFPTFPSNLGMFEGSLVGMAGQAGSWAIGPLINLLRSGKLRLTMYGKRGGGAGACAIMALWGK